MEQGSVPLAESAPGHVAPWGEDCISACTGAIVENSLTPFLCLPVQHMPVVRYSSELENGSYNRMTAVVA